MFEIWLPARIRVATAYNHSVPIVNLYIDHGTNLSAILLPDPVQLAKEKNTTHIKMSMTMPNAVPRHEEINELCRYRT